jgi:hypothetical protein
VPVVSFYSLLGVLLLVGMLVGSQEVFCRKHGEESLEGKSGCLQLFKIKLGGNKNSAIDSAKAVFCEFYSGVGEVLNSMYAICIFLISHVLINRKNTKRGKHMG